MPKTFEKIGNTDYKDIQNKQYITLDADAAAKTAQALTEQNIPFSGIKFEDSTKFTVSAENLDKFKVAAFDAVLMDKPVQERSQQKSQIIGNTDYKSIPDKQYANVSAEKAQSMAKVFEQKGVPFSGIIKGNKATITLSAKDMEQFKDELKEPEKKSVIGQLRDNKAKTSQQNKPKTPQKSKGAEIC